VGRQSSDSSLTTGKASLAAVTNASNAFAVRTWDKEGPEQVGERKEHSMCQNYLSQTMPRNSLRGVQRKQFLPRSHLHGRDDDASARGHLHWIVRTPAERLGCPRGTRQKRAEKKNKKTHGPVFFGPTCRYVSGQCAREQWARRGLLPFFFFHGITHLSRHALDEGCRVCGMRRTDDLPVVAAVRAHDLSMAHGQ